MSLSAKAQGLIPSTAQRMDSACVASALAWSLPGQRVLLQPLLPPLSQSSTLSPQAVAERELEVHTRVFYD